MEAFRGRKDIELFILFPNGRISDVQRKQMTAAQEENIHAIAIEGTFDDAQAIVKTLFGDPDFRTRHALSAINSINWARIIAQAVYYYTAHAKLGPDSRPSFTVPTGNFGDIFAGFAASKMGLPMGRLVIATNENDILARALETGRYEPREVMPTDSPSMDIQVSSNFERLLFEESGRDSRFVIEAMTSLRKTGAFEIPRFHARADARALFRASGQPRRGGGVHGQAFRRYGQADRSAHSGGACCCSKGTAACPGPMVVLGTAHPAKFPEAVKRATGRIAEIPERLQLRLCGQERFKLLPNSAKAVADFIEMHASTRHS